MVRLTLEFSIDMWISSNNKSVCPICRRDLRAINKIIFDIRAEKPKHNTTLAPTELIVENNKLQNENKILKEQIEEMKQHFETINTQIDYYVKQFGENTVKSLIKGEASFKRTEEQNNLPPIQT